MKLSLEPFVVAPQNITAEFRALVRWYDSQPSVRRLWAIKCAHQLRIIIAIEPTHDNNDVYPVWFANSGLWVNELQLRTGSAVQLELLQESPWGGIEIDSGSVVIADLFWRDATL
jgi:hypothetical protein